MDAAEFLDLSQATVIRSAEAGQIKCLTEKAGKRTRYKFRKQDLEEFLSNRFALGHETAKGANIDVELADFAPPNAMHEVNPIIDDVRRDHPNLFRGFGPMEWSELYSHRGTGGAMTYECVVDFAKKLRWKRAVRRKFEAVMETHLAEPLASLIETYYKQTELPT